MKALTKENIKAGLMIQQIAHPEYGTWPIVEKYGEGMWNIGRGAGRSMVLFEGNVKFWEIV